MPKEIEFQFKSPNESPGYLLGQVTMLWQRKLKAILDRLDLTQTQFVLLAALGWLLKKSNAVTQVDIANQSNTDRMMVSKVLRTLEKKKFISRQEHLTDTRAKVIKLTSEGTEVLQKALTVVENTDTEFFSVLGHDLPSFNQSMSNLIEQKKEEQKD
ncbi:MarR family transcriptional regulator [Aureibaculum algae]|uniref:MarR family transcriptional regulator n=1 Tax=Aureibaculum algae TaxID=2584122 RepID=A0A5B7TQC3_9FLAO|nr:MarR family transcriptional regulator [Aureibaculum algae]QCX37373.1 MarR family transcriptional regulator [Aureibaculum algae]